ncbi:MAG TPA: ATP-dependent DNA ligase [Actinomycetota bacterium]|nr:ATP-dependent DNA ligase [Actinomycetota bacterium]
MLLAEIARTSAELAKTAGRLAKVELLASCLRRLRPEEVPVAVAYLSGSLPQGTIGVGWASLRDVPGPAPAASLRLLDVHASFLRIQAAVGSGSQRVRREEIARLFSLATEPERTFLTGLLLGDLRQGALEGSMVEAVARASGTPAAEVRRALMVAGELGPVAAAALGGGSLAGFRLTVLRSVQPMLAQTAEDVEDAIRRLGRAAVEWKLDGARLQVHRLGDEVRAFTRNLADVTDRVPEVVNAVSALPLTAAILDGEAIALRDDRHPHPFQTTMSRFGSRLDVDRHRASTPLSPFFFDLLHLDGDDLIDRPGSERWAALEAVVPDPVRVPRVVVDDAEAAATVLDAALGAGHEGVMAKSLDAPYEAGRRGASWLKVKRAHTLDLVVLAAEWGHGRRRGWLSNLHLGARDPESGSFVMLGKTFKGLTDRMLAWQTDRLLELETRREGITVHVRPEIVVEIAFDGVQTSSRYPGGMALRFARVKGYRLDKRPEEADTVDTVRAIHDGRPDLSGGSTPPQASTRR